MLELKNITKIFNAGTVNEKVSLNNVNLILEDGDFVCVIGGNGAGKSTLLNTIAGTYKPNVGEIFINGENITFKEEHKRAKYFGRVFQDPMLGTCGNMQIIENLALANKRGLKRGLKWQVSAKDKEHYKEVLKVLDLDLENRLEAKVGLLSGGQRQAITLLMATLIKPDVLLLDEHTAALDPKTADKVLNITKEIVEKNNLTTLMITHNMKDAIKYGNRLIMMDNGRIIYDVKGEEKQKLKVSDLLEKFELSESSATDKMILG